MPENGDGMDHLRIPFEKIKFGQKLEGQGYGSVFEGEFDDRRVALKQLNITNLGNIKPKLLGEILTISKFRQHPNLVALIGFCDEKNNEITLVYEYVGSGNLAEKMRKRLTTIQRFEICLGAARGLDYLHTGVDSTTIVHGNIKLSKILLNSDSNSSKFEAKVSSFGLSKIVPGQAQKTLDSTDPEDEVTEKATKESDVYNFGVLLLEVLCGVPELVDTDDYQERHVTELVPKRLEQNRLSKIVHFDIRKEIKTEALETYAKIACQCVTENLQSRPTMAQVVEELEKALRLQGGEVSYVHIPATGINGSEQDESVIGDDTKEDGNHAIEDSKIVEKEPDDAKIVITDEDVKDLTSDEKLEFAGEENGDEISKFSTPTNDEKNEEDLIITQERSFPVSTLYNHGENVPEIANTEDVQNDNSNTIVLSTDNQETTKEAIPYLNSIEESKIIGQNEDDHESNNIIAALEPINGDTSTSDYSEGKDSVILESDNRNSNNLSISYRNNNEEVGDELQPLRIPFEKIKFGKKFDVDGYGSMFEGEYDDRKVALKRLNITNLGNIKPKLLAEILAVARFRKHPNIVSLIGFCDEKVNEIVIVYEYVCCGDLEDKMSKHLTTIQRLDICLGAARGLDYLHTGVDSYPGIIHGDIKLSKILLNQDSDSSKFEAKVSGFGLSKILPGQAQTIPDPIDNGNEVTGKVTKESDVYSFGVLLLEVLCGVPELVDTDDYQERHVTELVPKRLEQNLLRKIVHFDIRDEITMECLETYAKIACKCVMKDPEERPTMAEVVQELEKALRLQHGEVSDVQILGSSSNGNGLHEETIIEEDHEGHDDGEIVGLSTAEEESKVIEEPNDDMATKGKSIPSPVSVSEDGESVSNVIHDNGDEKESDESTNDLNNKDNIIEEPDLSDESKIVEENEVENGSKITTTAPDFDNGDSAVSIPIPVLGSEDNHIIDDTIDAEEESQVTIEPIDDMETQAKSFPTAVSVSEDGESLSKVKGDEKETNKSTNDFKSTDSITMEPNLSDESKIIAENEVDNGSKITTTAPDFENGDSAMSFPIPALGSEDIHVVDDMIDAKEAKKEGCNIEDEHKSKEEIMDAKSYNTTSREITMDLLTQDSSNVNANVTDRDFDGPVKLTSVGKSLQPESKRSNSSSSESSNGDESAPSDYLLQKSPANGGGTTKKTSNNQRNCCSCSSWRFFTDSLYMFQSCFVRRAILE